MLPYQGYDPSVGTGTYGHTSSYGQYSSLHGVISEPVSSSDSGTKSFIKIPKVVHNQREKFEKDDIFKRNSREAEIRYTLYRDRPHHERQAKFQAGCREGHTEIANSSTGLVLILSWNPMHSIMGYEQIISDRIDGMDFNKEPGKAHLRASVIINGVCCRFRGWIDLERLEGIGSLEFDEEMARVEDEILRREISLYDYKFKEFEKNGVLSHPHDIQVQQHSLPLSKKIH